MPSNHYLAVISIYVMHCLQKACLNLFPVEKPETKALEYLVGDAACQKGRSPSFPTEHRLPSK